MWTSETGLDNNDIPFSDDTTDADKSYFTESYLNVGEQVFRLQSFLAQSRSAICLYGLDTVYTNWGITAGQFEPLEDPAKECVKTCIAEDCSGEEQGWKVADCSEPLPFVCQYDCKWSRSL